MIMPLLLMTIVIIIIIIIISSSSSSSIIDTNTNNENNSVQAEGTDGAPTREVISRTRKGSSYGDLTIISPNNNLTTKLECQRETLNFTPLARYVLFKCSALCGMIHAATCLS